MAQKFCTRLFPFILCIVMIITCCACSASSDNSKDSSFVSKPEKIVDEIKSKCDLPEMKAISKEQLFTYYGIKEDDVAYFSAIVAGDSFSKDEVAVFEAIDEGEANAIRDSLQKHYDKVLKECDEYLPEEYKVVKACKVVKDGIYIRLFISAQAEKMDEIYNSYF